MAIVVGLAPFYNMPGDYFEMGSIITTRIVTLIQSTGEPPSADDSSSEEAKTSDTNTEKSGNPPAFEGIRSDDVFLLLKNVISQPSEVGLKGPGQIVIGLLLIGVSLVVDVILAFLTYALGSAVARVTIRPDTAQSPHRMPRRTDPH